MTDQMRLGTAFNQCFETLEAGEDLFAPDVFFDLLPPFWRFQLQGLPPSPTQLRELAGGTAVSARHAARRADRDRLRPGTRGDRAWRGGPAAVALRGARRRITEVLGYCNGGWDAALRARHAVEAPMLRPAP